MGRKLFPQHFSGNLPSPVRVRGTSRGIIPRPGAAINQRRRGELPCCAPRHLGLSARVLAIADNYNIWEFSARVLATLGAGGQKMSKSGQENRGYTIWNHGLCDDSGTFL